MMTSVLKESYEGVRRSWANCRTGNLRGARPQLCHSFSLLLGFLLMIKSWILSEFNNRITKWFGTQKRQKWYSKGVENYFIRYTICHKVFLSNIINPSLRSDVIPEVSLFGAGGCHQGPFGGLYLLRRDETQLNQKQNLPPPILLLLQSSWVRKRERATRRDVL